MKRTIFSMMALLLGSVAGCNGSSNTGACATVTCSADQFCDSATGTCKAASVCAGVACSAGTVCDGTEGSATAGKCISSTCGATQCTNGQVCNSATAACVNPGVPALGTQIDRMGRPAVNTALTNPFDLYPFGANAEVKDVTQARYNADTSTGVPLATTWSPAIALHLAILDSLNGSCATQLAYNQTVGTTNYPGYTFLAGVLGADAILVDSSKTSCTQYLGVEATALSVAGVPTNECGGRQLSYDVIDRTYSVLAAGTLSGVSDGIAVPTGATVIPTANFPYFAAPL